MQNLDMRHFTTVQTAADNDYVILNLGTGLAAKISVGLLKNLLTAKISPNIVDGVWHVGATSLDVSAEGKTPELRQGELGIEYKYTTEDDTAWRLLIPYTSIKLQYDMLTQSQKEEVFANVSAQIKSEVIEEVEEVTKKADEAILKAETATTDANKAAEEANKYANRVKDIDEAQWEEMEENKTWEEGVEYNVYERTEEEEVVEDEV